MSQAISLEYFHELLSESYAVTFNDTLYLVGRDPGGFPYLDTCGGGDYIDLSSVDGDVKLDETGAFFHLAGDACRVQFLTLRTF
jgi:hypothetical protein